MAKRKTGISDTDFLKAAATSTNMAELANKLGMSTSAAYVRKTRLRARGISVEFAAEPAQRIKKGSAKPDSLSKPEVEQPHLESAQLQPDQGGAYWVGVFDAVGKLDISAKNGISVHARFATAHKLLADMFYGRYGGTVQEGDGIHAVILSQDDDGLHQLVCDLSGASVRYGNQAAKLCQWLEYRFYLQEQERALIEELRESD